MNTRFTTSFAAKVDGTGLVLLAHRIWEVIVKQMIDPLGLIRAVVGSSIDIRLFADADGVRVSVLRSRRSLRRCRS